MKRILSILMAFTLIISVIPFSAAAAGSVPSIAGSEEWEVVKLVNKERINAGLKPVSITAGLQSATDIRAKELLESFSHTRPNGESCFTVFSESGVSYTGAGENIAAGQANAAAVMNGWMNSPGHKANILKSDFTHIGVGYNPNKSAQGYTKQWVQLFTYNNCTFSDIKLSGSATITAAAGTALSDMNIAVEGTCAKCGKFYMPVIDEMASGYNKSSASNQNVSVTVEGKTISFTVARSGAGETPDPDSPAPFTDINMWAKEAIEWVYENNLFTGTSAKTFSPNLNMNRAMLATVLWRLDGKPKVSGANGFTDVNTGEYYGDAVKWAEANNIVTGTGNNKFSPSGDITRQQLAAMLYRYAKYKGESVSYNSSKINAFPDNEQVSSYAAEAMGWAVDNGLITGKDGKLDPSGKASRAQVATILMRYAG